jgi:hypothetical protein
LDGGNGGDHGGGSDGEAGSGAEGDENKQQQAAAPVSAGESTPLLRKQLLHSRTLPGDAVTPGQLNMAAAEAEEEGGSETPAARPAAGVAAAGRTPTGAATTPASVPVLGKAAALRK